MVNRIDKKVLIKLDKDIQKDGFKITPHGFMYADAFVTRSGIFEYVSFDENGNQIIIRELRPEEEVFNSESMDSLKLIPLTWQHPSEMITVDNVKQYQVGTTGENIAQQEEYVACKLMITDQNLIAEILRRAKEGESVELSCGYDCDIEIIKGVSDKYGEYDAIQHNIRYNHLSIVDYGRAGREVKIKFDEGEQTMKKIKIDGFKSKKFSFDGVEVEVDEKVAPIVEKLGEQVTEMGKAISETEKEVEDANVALEAEKAKAETLKSEVETLQKDNAELMNLDGEKVKALVKERADMEDMAEKFDVDKTLKIDEMKVAIIKKVRPTLNLDGKSADYIKATFETVVDVVNMDEEARKQLALGSFRKATVDTEGKVDAREKFMKDSRDLSKEKE